MEGETEAALGSELTEHLGFEKNQTGKENHREPSQWRQFISSATDDVSEHLEIWRNRELDPMYPIVFFDAIVVKVHENGHVAKLIDLSGSNRGNCAHEAGI